METSLGQNWFHSAFRETRPGFQKPEPSRLSRSTDFCTFFLQKNLPGIALSIPLEQFAEKLRGSQPDKRAPTKIQEMYKYSQSTQENRPDFISFN
jgi:hypothetical protein